MNDYLTALIVAGVVAFLVAMIRKITGKTYEDNAPSITDARPSVPDDVTADKTVNSANFSVGISLLATFVIFSLFAFILVAFNAGGGSPIAAFAGFIAYRGMRHGKIL